MRTLILYYSKNGSTQRYAEEIGNAVHGDVMPIKKFKPKMNKDYDTIVFGGRVVGSRIQKVDDFLRFYDDMKEKNVIIFSVGMSLVSKESRAGLISSNILDLYHVRFYQLRGSFNYSELGFVDRLMMANSLRVIANDPEATVDQRALLDIKERPIEYYDQAGVDRIISVLHRLAAIPAE